MISINDLEKYIVKLNEPLSNYTYTKVGGPADILVFPRSIEEVIELTKLVRITGTPLTVLGNASNLIVRDGGIRGMVMLFEKLDRVSVSDTVISAESGAKLKDVTYFAQEKGLSGLEFACGIPGSVGGAAYMNAGAYEGEVANVISSVLTLNPVTGEVREFLNLELAFSYRKSLIREENLIVLSVNFVLKIGNKAQIQAKMLELDALRAGRQPLEYPSCGSVFKRPKGYFAGPLIQQADCQGHRIGGVEVSMKHAGFMVNVNHGTAKDYEDLINWVIEKVKKNSGVTLEPEVRIIGESLIK